jgi:ATP-binding cassette subfamily C (CFTR/MRP) protein 1
MLFKHGRRGFSLRLESVDGLLTIRAFQWEQKLQHRCSEALDISQKPYYLLFCIQRWLILVLGLMVAGTAVVLVAFAIQLQQPSSGGRIGAAFIAILGLNDQFNLLITSWTNLEMSLGAIARLMRFTETTDPETWIHKDDQRLENWPHGGETIFNNATTSYM